MIVHCAEIFFRLHYGAVEHVSDIFLYKSFGCPLATGQVWTGFMYQKPPKSFMGAYIFCCNKCHLWGSGMSSDLKKYSYQCYRCNQKQRVILRVSGTQVIHRGPMLPKEAALMVQEINDELSLMKSDDD